MNTLSLSGTIKSIQLKTGNNDWSCVTARLSQRGDVNGRETTIVTMPLVALDKKVQEQLLEHQGEEVAVKITGRLVTKFDRRPGITNEERKQSYTQIEIGTVEFV